MKILAENCMNLQELNYFNHVARIAESGSGEEIPNGDIPHAKILIQQLLLRGGKEVNIFTSNLKPEIYDDPKVLESLKAFLNRNAVKLNVLLQHPEEISLDREIFKIFKDKKSACKINYVTESEHKKLSQHFITMDDKAYRFCQDFTIPKAVASFNSPKVVANLKTQFLLLFEKSKEFAMN